MTTGRLPHEWDAVAGKCPHCHEEFKTHMHPAVADIVHNCTHCGAFIEIARAQMGFTAKLWSLSGKDLFTG